MIPSSHSHLSPPTTEIFTCFFHHTFPHSLLFLLHHFLHFLSSFSIFFLSHRSFCSMCILRGPLPLSLHHRLLPHPTVLLLHAISFFPITSPAVFSTGCSHPSITFAPLDPIPFRYQVYLRFPTARKKLSAFIAISSWTSICFSSISSFSVLHLYNSRPRLPFSSRLWAFCPYKAMICSSQALACVHVVPFPHHFHASLRCCQKRSILLRLCIL